MAQRTVENVDPLINHPVYHKIRDLSRGTFGFVQLCFDSRTNEEVAIKFLRRGPLQPKYHETEILNHRQLRHPHVVEFKETFLTDEYLCIVMEFANRGTLFDFIKNAEELQSLREATARWFFQQLIVALDYCHKKGVVNRDVKLENTLLHEIEELPLPLLKICDFGYSKAQTDSVPKSKVGTLAYMAPEVTRPGKQQYDGTLVDIWSCGVMLYVMLFGKYPFKDDRKEKNGEKRSLTFSYNLVIPEDVQITPDCRDLLCRLLETDPSKRLRMYDILQHPWFLLNLPEGVLHMNEGYLSGGDEDESASMQSKEEIMAILKEAASPDTPDEDNMIAQAITDELNDPRSVPAYRPTPALH
eukprot:CAMPEP_0175075364 /NCGR_PEP_ID=MMETSP0052_2-20121109/21954_1 /TAXON_ID=51329 ORGANISM="Polytomella parva, Strain SAG 63-3" /NCGR_SAMPLE_ID=MMETSP0052_2 /ASSEMBLY_ACC=CAM_ASM_000194 /LENGTH=356 /DNA_ID=CAMNT_0016344031 /DNA_START=37 /DNA_END=1108 /DNA_ORIENTATION=-